MATTQKSCQKQLAAPHRSSDRGTALTGRIIGNQLLVPLELAPGDVAFVPILEQHLPIGQRAPQAALDALAAILDRHLAHHASKGIRPSVDRVRQDVVDGIVQRQPPDDATPLHRAVACDGQCDAIVPQPYMHLSHASQLGELGEDQPEGVLHPLIRVLLDPVTPDPHVASRNTEE